MLDWGVGVKLWDIICPQLSFWGVNNRWASAWVRLKDMSVSTLGPPPLWTFLSRARLALNISRHSSSNHGLDFFGTVVALGMLSFAALMTSSTKDVRILEDMSCNFIDTWLSEPLPVSLWEHLVVRITPLVCVCRSRRHRYQDRVVVTTMCVRKDLPCTSKGGIRCTDREVDGWCGVVWVLSLWF